MSVRSTPSSSFGTSVVGGYFPFFVGVLRNSGLSNVPLQASCGLVRCIMALAGSNDSVARVCVALAGMFPVTTDENVTKERWRKVRLFLSAFLAEPAINFFSGCHHDAVEIFARLLLAGRPSSKWIHETSCIEQVVFVWQFLVLMCRGMDQNLILARAVGELLLFALGTNKAALAEWESKADGDAQRYREDWEVGGVDKYRDRLRASGIADTTTQVMSDHVRSQARLVEQANEERTGQVWPGRAAVRAGMYDLTAIQERSKASVMCKQKNKKPKAYWPHEDCRHDCPDSVMRAPGVITFLCGCGYIIGFELLQETESSAHILSGLVQRFKKLTRVIYFETACQAQRKTIRRVPWLLHEAITSWFIDRFHRCNHRCYPVFDADEYPNVSRGHDTSGAERQHSLKKKSKGSLTHMSQRRFIVRSRIMAANTNIRLSQRRSAARRQSAPARASSRGNTKSAKRVEVQHHPVQTYYHDAFVSHCERMNCTCREHRPVVPAPGLKEKM